MGASFEGLGSRLEVVEKVPRIDGRGLAYREFWRAYVRQNRPVLLTGLTPSWRACCEWVQETGGPDLDQISKQFGSAVVQVAECETQEYTDQKRLKMTVAEFISYWQSLQACRYQNKPVKLLYLKDWHFVKDYPEYCAYTTPEFFKDDWLNSYYDEQQASDPSARDCSDYRFVYMGPMGTWTPLHADVFRSYSWSANICGRKIWHLLPPEQTSRLYDRHQQQTVYNIYGDVSAEMFPEFSKTHWFECNQEAGEILFVPSGWYHQVTNVEDTISINHNWLNACNLHWAWRLLHDDYKATIQSIEDIRAIADNFEDLCQRNLAANSGMNFKDFFLFLLQQAGKDHHTLVHNRAFWEENCRTAEPKYSGTAEENQRLGQCGYNLLEIQKVLLSMSSQELFARQLQEKIPTAPRDISMQLKLCEECGSVCSQNPTVCCTVCPQLLSRRGPLSAANVIEHCLSIAFGVSSDTAAAYPEAIESLLCWTD